MPGFISIKKQKKHAVLNFFNIKIKFKLNTNKRKLSHPVIVILGPLGIGDYMIYRPYFKYIKMSPKFQNASIIYISRDIYKDFVINYDSDLFDVILDYDVLKINTLFYRKYLLKMINSYKPDVFYSLTPNSNNNKNYINLYKKIKARDKYIGYLVGEKLKNKKVNNKLFNHLLYCEIEKEKLFETERCRKEFECFLDMKIPPQNKQDKEDLNILMPLKPTKKHIAISFLSSDTSRMLKQSKWIDIINYLIEKTDDNTEILFLGSQKERKIVNTLFHKLDDTDKCVNLSGISISLIPVILNSCEFLISVESGNVHIAHEVGCKTLCLSGSICYGRFHPYKDNIVKYIYPDEFIEYIKNNPNTYIPYDEELFSVKEIKTETVIEEIQKLLDEKSLTV